MADAYAERTQANADIKARDDKDEVDRLKAVSDQHKKYNKEVYSGAMSLAGAVSDLYIARANRQIEKIEEEKAVKLDQLSAEEKAELAANEASGDTAAQKAARAIEISEKYDAKKAAIEKQAAEREKKIAYEANLAAWKIQKAITIASGARAVI